MAQIEMPGCPDRDAQIKMPRSRCPDRDDQIKMPRLRCLDRDDLIPIFRPFGSIVDNLNPDFLGKVIVEYFFEVVQILKFEVHDISLGGKKIFFWVIFFCLLKKIFFLVKIKKI